MRVDENGIEDIEAVMHTLLRYLTMNQIEEDSFGDGRSIGNNRNTLIFTFSNDRSLVERKLENDIYKFRDNIVKKEESLKDFFGMYSEILQWNQRLYSFFFEQQSPNEKSAFNLFENLSKRSSGRCYNVNSLRQFLSFFDLISADYPNSEAKTVTVMMNYNSSKPSKFISENYPVSISSNRKPFNWIIPESYWPQNQNSKLEARESIPFIQLQEASKNLKLPEGFPFSEFHIDSDDFLKDISTLPPNSCLTMYIKKSNQGSNNGFPFGFIHYFEKLNTASMVLLPYNFPKFQELIIELYKFPKRIPNTNWNIKFQSYLSSVPVYYYPLLKSAFKVIGLSTLIDEKPYSNWKGSPWTNVITQIRLKCKIELENSSIFSEKRTQKRKNVHDNLLQEEDMYCRADEIPKVLENARNYFLNFLAASTETKKNSVPIHEMGNYLAKMMANPTLRNPLDEDADKKRMTFINPYKSGKKIVDEGDMDLMLPKSEEAQEIKKIETNPTSTTEEFVPKDVLPSSASSFENTINIQELVLLIRNPQKLVLKDFMDKITNMTETQKAIITKESTKFKRFKLLDALSK